MPRDCPQCHASLTRRELNEACLQASKAAGTWPLPSWEGEPFACPRCSARLTVEAPHFREVRGVLWLAHAAIVGAAALSTRWFAFDYLTLLAMVACSAGVLLSASRYVDNRTRLVRT